MPTVEDTAVDFPVTTLNDLLEAEAKAGVAAGADEDKYRRWAFLSTGAAVLLAIVLAVVLITGGGDGEGGSESKAQTAQKPTGWSEVPLSVPSENRLGGAKAGDYVKVTSAESGTVLVKAGMVTLLTKGAKIGGVEPTEFLLAVPPEEETALITADKKSLLYQKVDAPPPGQPAETPTTTAPVSASEMPTTPTPEAPAPEAPVTQPAG